MAIKYLNFGNIIAEQGNTKFFLYFQDSGIYIQDFHQPGTAEEDAMVSAITPYLAGHVPNSGYDVKYGVIVTWVKMLYSGKVI